MEASGIWNKDKVGGPGGQTSMRLVGDQLLQPLRAQLVPAASMLPE